MAHHVSVYAFICFIEVVGVGKGFLGYAFLIYNYVFILVGCYFELSLYAHNIGK